MGAQSSSTVATSGKPYDHLEFLASNIGFLTVGKRSAMLAGRLLPAACLLESGVLRHFGPFRPPS